MWNFVFMVISAAALTDAAYIKRDKSGVSVEIVPKNPWKEDVVEASSVSGSLGRVKRQDGSSEETPTPQTVIVANQQNMTYKYGYETHTHYYHKPKSDKYGNSYYAGPPAHGYTTVKQYQPPAYGGYGGQQYGPPGYGGQQYGPPVGGYGAQQPYMMPPPVPGYGPPIGGYGPPMPMYPPMGQMGYGAPMMGYNQQQQGYNNNYQQQGNPKNNTAYMYSYDHAYHNHYLPAKSSSESYEVKYKKPKYKVKKYNFYDSDSVEEYDDTYMPKKKSYKTPPVYGY